ncbi:MAG: type I polyketide synthase, partial [Phycisphaerae bacterium]|nr:type I polyketide synthase [Phycisphaerae bacterium]
VRVRLPDEPLMLVDRILSVDGERASLTSGRIVTEHDVLAGAWYLDGGRCPISIAVEAGQADLFLCSHLGIDLAVKGTRSYRLLDATVTFHRGLPRPGEAIRYEITIDRFVRQGETYLFFFRFDGTIDGELVLTMRNGCAGFFTAAEIEDSGGIILTDEDAAPVEGRVTAGWQPLVPMSAGSYDDGAVAALRGGDLAGCFGPMFAGLGLRDVLRLPDGRMKLFDRVLELDPAGGRYGLGMIRAEADIHPDDWFLTCHFVDDMTMPGTLMYECCLHALRFFLLRTGWVGEQAGVCYEPVPGISGALRCRGPVTPDTKKVVYQVEMKEIGYRPEPYVIADALMFADGKRIVQMKDMSLRIMGLSRERIEATWGGKSKGGSRRPQPRNAVPVRKPAVFDKDRILAFAIGKPSEAFGEPYRVFDSDRRIARLPGPPYQFLDRIVGIEPEAWRLEPGGWVEAEYDVPPDAWYFRANRQAAMPFCVLLEVALQPCGWLAAYSGSALRSEVDLLFRNLGGTATAHEEVLPDAGTLTTRVRLTNVSEAGGMIIEKFVFRVLREGRVVYEGDTSFGFFSEAALARQVGIRDAEQRTYVPVEKELASGRRIELEDVAPLTPDDPAGAVGPGALPPGRALRMIDEVEVLVPDGGPHGLGYVRAVAAVDPAAWFFKAHFYQDPVWPGSLGLESFLQLLKVYALDRWGGAREGILGRAEAVEPAEGHRFEPIALGVEHTWTYRGQIIPGNRHVGVEAVVTRREDGPSPLLVADGFLRVDGAYIYEMAGFGLRLVRE